jgi:hypothetical protein
MISAGQDSKMAAILLKIFNLWTKTAGTAKKIWFYSPGFV